MPEYDIALELARLHILKGADFVNQLKKLTGLHIFKTTFLQRKEATKTTSLYCLMQHVKPSNTATKFIFCRIPKAYERQILYLKVVVFTRCTT